jgi:endonuclease-3
VRAVEDKLEKVVPPEFRRNAHHWLILHGRYVCKARRPNCPECAIRDLCAYKYKTPDPLVVPAKAGAQRLPGGAEPRKKRR